MSPHGLSIGSRRPALATDAQTLVELARSRAAHQPDGLAYRFLQDGEDDAVCISYAQLDSKARAVAALLQQSGATGGRALLIYPPGLEYITAFLGCLYAGVTAVPAYPPNPARLARTLPRLQAIASDAGAQFALTQGFILELMQSAFADARDLQALRWLATDDLSPGLENAWAPPEIGRQTLAFLQYTSGSTSTPKGVMLSHGNLLHNSGLIHDCYEHSPASHAVIWLPPYHDMGLIGGILQPLYGGFPGTLLSPIDFLTKPLRWLKAVSKYGGTTSGGPNFAFDLCVRKTTPEDRAALDLSRWNVAFNGAEPIRTEVLDRFVEAFAPAGFRREAFYPCYGLAEGTLLITGGRVAEAPVVGHFDAAALLRHQIAEPSGEARTLVGGGKTTQGQRLAIANPDTRVECGAGEVGEIWVQGDSVAQGYWNNPEATERFFRATLAPGGEGPFLRTGDLGFLQQGELFITGRLKDLLIIRGRNHYPQDLERTVESSHPALRPGCGAAFCVELDGEEKLVVVQELERAHRDTDSEEVARAVRQAIADEHGLQLHALALIESGSIFKTSSGKIQRHACRAAFESGELSVVASVASVEEPIVPALSRSELMAAALSERPALIGGLLRSWLASALKVPVRTVGSTEPIVSMGLDSLMAVELKNMIEDQLGLDCPLARILEGASVEELSATLVNALTLAPALPPPTALELGPTPLSHGQRALWFMHQLAPNSTAYHLARAVRIHSQLDATALQQAFQALIDRHPALRTTFSSRGGEPFAQLHPQAQVCFELEDATGWSPEALEERLDADSQKRFELERGPLFRVSLFRRGPQDHVLLLVVHHLVADFWSLVQLVSELVPLYLQARAGKPLSLPLPGATPADHTQWQSALLQSPEGAQLWEYWRSNLAGVLPTLELHTDRPRPAVQTYRGASHAFSIDPALTVKLKALAQSSGATLYATLLAGFQVLLHRYSGQDDLLIGSPAAGRSRSRFTGLFGYLVSPVVLRARFEDQPSFATLLERTRRSVLGALEHQDFPLPLLVERLQPRRDPSRSPLFQTMFVLQRAHALADEGMTAFSLDEAGARMELGGLSIESLALSRRVAQFDLTLSLAEVGPGLSGAFEYNSDLFEPSTLSRMAEHFQVLLAGIVDAPQTAVGAFALESDANPRAPRLARVAGSCVGVTRRVAAQAALSPEAIAIQCGEERLTYRDLDERANRLAHRLVEQGIGLETIVGVCLPRSPELVVAELAILKAGGAFLPLDPSLPADRLAFMLDDSRAQLLITTTPLAAVLPSTPRALLLIDRESPALNLQGAEAPKVEPKGEQLAYVVYTSGSTGRPKGVLVTHGAFASYLDGAQGFLRLSPTDRVLQLSGIGFDVAAEEIFPTLCRGATLVLWPEQGVPGIPELVKFLDRERLTVVNLPSPYWHIWVEALGSERNRPPRSLRLVVTGSEKTSSLHFERWRRAVGIQPALISGYGPTEATITSLVFEPESDAMSVDTACLPIGRPVGAIEAWVLDPLKRPVPTGVPGELWLGGPQLARGYLGLPELTAARFVPAPFDTGSRLYGTGDRVRQLPDGNFEFLGRLDEQIKVRGFRIEPGEIEATLATHPTVRQAVVIARPDAAGSAQLLAYVVSVDPTPDANGLRAWLKARLPEPMIPAIFTFLSSLPLSVNGKIDRRALPVPVVVPRASIAPTNDLERLIAKVWREALGLEQVGIQDNFFDLGGHSLLMVRVHSKLEDVLGRSVTMVELFQHPTIHELAAFLSQAADPNQGIREVQDRASRQRAALEKARKKRSPSS